MKDLIKNIKPLSNKYNNIFASTKKRENLKPKFSYSNSLEIDEKTYQAMLDRKSKKNFKMERSIDLHRYTKEEAFLSLTNFFLKAIKDDISHVIVITGGSKLKKSVLREAFLEWIKNEFRIYISAYSEAHIKNGGEGAFYIVLRKARRYKQSLLTKFSCHKK